MKQGLSIGTVRLTKRLLVAKQLEDEAMNAQKFIKDHGIVKAREVVEGAPSNAESYQGGYYFRTKPEFQFHNGFHPVWNLTDNDGEWFKKDGFDPVVINDLKRLVESVELIKTIGGIEVAKRKVEMADFNGFLLISFQTKDGLASVYIQKAQQAIADYEAIGGEHV